MKTTIIIDSNSLNSDLDFRLDFVALSEVLLDIGEMKKDETKFFYFDHEDSAKHTFYFSMKAKGYEVKLKPADYRFVQPQYIQCHCCETLVLDPATNKNVFNLDLGAEITHFIHANVDKFDQFSFVTGNGDFAVLAQYLESINKLGKVILPNSKVGGEIISKNLESKKIIKLENYYIRLGKTHETKVFEKQKPSALSKFGKRK